VDQTPISYGRWYSAKKISNSSDPWLLIIKFLEFLSKELNFYSMPKL
jgi:hypothetical protein